MRQLCEFYLLYLLLLTFKGSLLWCRRHVLECVIRRSHRSYLFILMLLMLLRNWFWWWWNSLKLFHFHNYITFDIMAKTRLVAMILFFAWWSLIKGRGHLLELGGLHRVRICSDFFDYFYLIALLGSVVVFRELLMQLSVVIVIAPSLKGLARRRWVSWLHGDCRCSCLCRLLLLLLSILLLLNVLNLLFDWLPVQWLLCRSSCIAKLMVCTLYGRRSCRVPDYPGLLFGATLLINTLTGRCRYCIVPCALRAPLYCAWAFLTWRHRCSLSDLCGFGRRSVPRGLKVVPRVAVLTYTFCCVSLGRGWDFFTIHEITGHGRVMGSGC